jgi:sterol desaturase/sphingolipid hydroxylase (fatty acid hydroxylase superfamily)
MSDAELWAAWRFWMGVALIVVAVAAALLVAILVTARRILAEAARTFAAVEEIQRHTTSIWQLQATRETAERILALTRRLESATAALAEALSGRAVPRG